jgi:cytoplasmic iron level regulating protein YaaA (DUF328/UPF0246 family)
LVNNNYEDLSNPKFLANYKNMSDKFLKKSKNELMNYLKCSERIQKYNEQRGLDVKKEFFKNNQNAVKFLAELQKHINTNPNAFIYLRSINK